jgi:hypothetical protein
MSCKIPYIEQQFRDVNPSLADTLNTKYSQIWDSVIESELFKKEEDTGKYLMATTNISRLQEQQDFIDKVNQDNSVPEGTSVIENLNGYVNVNVLNLPEVTGVSTPAIKEGVEDLFDSNPELASQVYEALGFRTPNITVLPNGNLKIVAFRTEKVGPTSKGEYQRGKGLYLSLDKPYPGEDVYTVKIEISPKNLLDRKLGFGEISEDFFIDEKNKRVDKQLDTLAEFKQSLGIKAEIGSIDGALMNELVLFDKDLINQAIASKKEYNPQQKQQALQLYSQYLDTGKQDIEGFKEFVNKQPKSKVNDVTVLEDVLSVESPDTVGKINNLINRGILDINCS